ncbi:PHD finger protein 20-like [Scleropages formosus]|uniref:PHD finger protein 20-like n=1 Tax=Scleropages formosus TaxID=113540 RepID=UPI0010FA9AC3|nr:PHD finger protein 20-like [Scleropages formosus]
MKKTPPNRRGITFEVGAQLEARDSLKNWYAANIEKIDYEDEKVLIHYRQWSHRYDEWFDWASPYLRPLERIQLRREGLQDDCTIPGFHVNEKVLASWSDCRFYPAKVLAVNKDASYTVKFYDGVIQTVKGIHVKPFIKEKKGGKQRSVERNKQKPPVRRKPLENGGSSKSRRGRRDGSEQDGESETEEEEEEASEDEEQDGEDGGEEKPLGVQPEQEEKGGSRWEKSMKRKVCDDDVREEPKRRVAEKKKPAEKSRRQGPEAEMSIVEKEEKVDGELGVGERKAGPVESREGGEEEEAAERVPVEDLPQERERKMKQEEEDVAVEPAEEEQQQRGAGQGRTQGRKTRGRVSAARRTEGASRGVLELRKRKVSLGQTPPSKKSKPDTSAEKSAPADPSVDTPAKSPAQAGPGLEQRGSDVAPHDAERTAPPGQTEGPSPAGDTPPVPPSKAAPARRQANNPNRFSREPLYRVIKNQPPPVTFINLDHNPFKCQVAGCLKSFRKAKLLHYHMKYYHSGDEAPGPELSPTRSAHTRTSDKQSAASPESPRRRRTISASMHSALHSPHRTPQSPRGDAKGGAKPVERRRTSAPPAVHLQNQHRLSLRDKTKESQLERGGRRPQERLPAETAFAKERDRAREKKQRDFLRIKLKKRRKKKPKSDEASGSDTSTDSLGWSDDDLGEELDVTTPPEELPVAMGTRGSDIIRCVCEVEEDNDFMVQCEECLCWQHGACMGLLEENIPGRYTCYICRDPPGQRQSQRYWCDRDWLSSGHMYGLPFLEENYSHQNAKKMAATHQLLGDVHRVVEVLNGLQLKMSVLQSQTNSDLKLWRQPWKQSEKPKRKGVVRSGTVPSLLTEEGEDRGGASRNSPTVDAGPCGGVLPPQQASYISSEHCYQKPRTYYPAVEQRLVVETRAGGSDLEHSLRSTEDLLALERNYGTLLDPDTGRTRGALQADRIPQSKEVDGCKRLPVGQCCEVKSEDQGCGAGGLRQQWQANLLDHIEAVQDEVTHRMDFIERELDVLESWLDYTGELEPPEPLARLPQLKHRVKQLLSELAKVQQIAHCCAT